jgi:hypothetical protein
MPGTPSHTALLGQAPTFGKEERFAATVEEEPWKGKRAKTYKPSRKQPIRKPGQHGIANRCV